MSAYCGAALLACGAASASLPSLGGLPIFGYAAIAALLFGAVLLVPTLTVRALGWAPRTRGVVVNTAVAQLRENVGLSTLSLASIIVSFSLMVAMAIMVYSFRVSFDHWLGKLLPADLQLRVPFGNDTAYWSSADQASLAAVEGVSRVEFRRTRQLLLDPARAPVTLIARGATEVQAAQELPLVRSFKLPLPANAEPAWISEALQDLYGYELGGRIEAALRTRFARGDSLEILTSTALRERSLQIFDRAFAITYALEAIAVIIGLTGVSFAASSTALARRAEFGMLRHIGMLRRQILGMLASEGILTSAFGVAYGLALGTALSLVLVYVINRQSFNWSIDLAIPAWQLAVLSVTLIIAAAVTAIWSGRAATRVISMELIAANPRSATRGPREYFFVSGSCWR